MSIKIWDYSNSTETIWANFDCGEVEAETYEEAREKAILILKEDLRKANEKLAEIDMSIEMSFDDLQVQEPRKPIQIH